MVAAVDPLDWMDQGLPEWRCTSTRIGRVYDTETGQDKLSLDFDIPDAWLRPVSGLPIDEDVTEDLKEPA
ncbi:hypothetical protein A6456_10675 [Paraburkholderia tropica]|nr:hypothetical protein A6456_10675 [Paraburkholderia tropica]